MPRIPILDYEAKVQIGDKTRFDAEKSFATKDITAAISAVQIAPGSEDAIDVIDDDPRERWLDWVWTDWKWDIDETFNTIYFTVAGVEYEAVVDTGEFAVADLLVAIENVMTDSGAGAFEASVDDLNQITIEADVAFTIQVRNKDAALLSILGFKLDSESAKTSFVGARVETARRKVDVLIGTTIPSGGAEEDHEDSKTFYVELYTPETDYLFSSDQDLLAEEPDILKWVSKGRSTHLSVHRKAQQHIIDWLNRNGYRDIDGESLTKWAVVDLDQVRLWSSYMALKFIFSGIKNAVDDVFGEKASAYEKLEVMARQRAVIELALTATSRTSGKPDKDMSPSSWSGQVVRR